MSLRSDFESAHPEFPWLDLSRPEGFERFLRERRWIEEDEKFLGCERAGEGNMNLAARIRTDRCTLIVKQARPWVEKYETLAAPWNRMEAERRFYDRVRSIAGVADLMPAILHADSAACALCLEFLSDARDYSELYAGAMIGERELDALTGYLAALHRATEGQADPAFANREMRELNHEHIYRVPMDGKNGIELEKFEPGLTDAAAELRRDSAVTDRTAETGRRYLRDGPCLLHGDFFPGSWLRTLSGVKVIDSEFCFYGDREFDLGNLIAHLALSGQELDLMRRVLSLYDGIAGTTDGGWIARYAACEVVRRLIGVAQLPIPPSDGFRAGLLAKARRAMKSESVEDLWT